MKSLAELVTECDSLGIVDAAGRTDWQAVKTETGPGFAMSPAWIQAHMQDGTTVAVQPEMSQVRLLPYNAGRGRGPRSQWNVELTDTYKNIVIGDIRTESLDEAKESIAIMVCGWELGLKQSTGRLPRTMEGLKRRAREWQPLPDRVREAMGMVRERDILRTDWLQAAWRLPGIRADISQGYRDQMTYLAKAVRDLVPEGGCLVYQETTLPKVGIFYLETDDLEAPTFGAEPPEVGMAVPYLAGFDPADPSAHNIVVTDRDGELLAKFDGTTRKLRACSHPFEDMVGDENACREAFEAAEPMRVADAVARMRDEMDHEEDMQERSGEITRDAEKVR